MTDSKDQPDFSELRRRAEAGIEAEHLEPESMSPEALEAVRDGRIHVQLAWQSGLPGNPPLLAVPDVVYGVLTRAPAEGEYAGELQAPLAEGYYRLLSQAWLDGVRVTDTDLLIVDDGHPGWSIDPVTGKVVARAP